MQHLSKKDAISGFPVSPGSTEALMRWGGKIKNVLIAYFLGNICAKNYRNRTIFVKIIASQRWDVFWDTVYSVNTLAVLGFRRQQTDLIPQFSYAWNIYKKSTRNKQKAWRQSHSAMALCIRPRATASRVTTARCDARDDRRRRCWWGSSVNEAPFTRAHNGEQAPLTLRHRRTQSTFLDTSGHPATVVTLAQWELRIQRQP